MNENSTDQPQKILLDANGTTIWEFLSFPDHQRLFCVCRDLRHYEATIEPVSRWLRELDILLAIQQSTSPSPSSRHYPDDLLQKMLYFIKKRRYLIRVYSQGWPKVEHYPTLEEGFRAVLKQDYGYGDGPFSFQYERFGELPDAYVIGTDGRYHTTDATSSYYGGAQAHRESGSFQDFQGAGNPPFDSEEEESSSYWSGEGEDVISFHVDEDELEGGVLQQSFGSNQPDGDVSSYFRSYDDDDDLADLEEDQETDGGGQDGQCGSYQERAIRQDRQGTGTPTFDSDEEVSSSYWSREREDGISSHADAEGELESGVLKQSFQSNEPSDDASSHCRVYDEDADDVKEDQERDLDEQDDQGFNFETDSHHDNETACVSNNHQHQQMAAPTHCMSRFCQKTEQSPALLFRFRGSGRFYCGACLDRDLGLALRFAPGRVVYMHMDWCPWQDNGILGQPVEGEYHDHYALDQFRDSQLVLDDDESIPRPAMGQKYWPLLLWSCSPYENQDLFFVGLSENGQ